MKPIYDFLPESGKHGTLLHPFNRRFYNMLKLDMCELLINEESVMIKVIEI